MTSEVHGGLRVNNSQEYIAAVEEESIHEHSAPSYIPLHPIK